ncbi:MAG: hypothetical protein RR806_04220 [Oscillospiraceae bacterium]
MRTKIFLKLKILEDEQEIEKSQRKTQGYNRNKKLLWNSKNQSD